MQSKATWLAVAVSMVLVFGFGRLYLQQVQKIREPGQNSSDLAAEKLDSRSETLKTTTERFQTASMHQKTSSLIPKVFEPLPARDLPLSQTFDALKRRADGGDARAACLLAEEMETCLQVRAQISMNQPNDDWIDNSNKHITDPIKRAETIERMKKSALDGISRTLERESRCKGVPPFSPSDVLKLRRIAAERGHVESMARYASGDSFSRHGAFTNMEETIRYHANAEAMATRAAKAGQMGALLLLAQAYSPINNSEVSMLPISQVVKVDAIKAHAMLSIVSELEAVQPMNSGQMDFIRRQQERLQKDLAVLSELMGTEDRARAKQLKLEIETTWRIQKRVKNLTEILPGMSMNGRCESTAFN